MSVAVTARVLKQSQQRGAAKLLLVVLADYAGSEGLCWPGIRALSEIINESERHTIRLLSQLEAKGEIARKPGIGRGHMTIYAILTGLSPHEQAALITALQNTVIKNTVLQNSALPEGNSDILGRNSDMSGQEIVTSSAEIVTSSAEDEGPNTSLQGPKTDQNQKYIRHGSVNHDPSGSVREGAAASPPSPAAPPPQHLSPAEQLLKEHFPRLKLSEQQRQAISETVINLDGWRCLLRLWRDNGWRPLIGNILDRYRKEAANEQGPSAAPHRAGRLPGNVSPTSERAGHPAIGVPPPPGSPPVLKAWEIKERRERRLREHEAAERAARAAAA